MYKLIIIIFLLFILLYSACNTSTEPNKHDQSGGITSFLSNRNEDNTFQTITIIDSRGKIIETGVNDLIIDNNETLSQKIQLLADNAKNKGEFVSRLMSLSKELMNRGFINNEDAIQLLKILIRGDIP